MTWWLGLAAAPVLAGMAPAWGQAQPPPAHAPAAAGQAAGQQAPAPPQAAASAPAKQDVGGVVVDARSGRRLSRATVTLSETGGGRVLATARTDEDGRFLFRDVRRGKYALRGEARGYVGANFQEHDEFSTAIAVGEGFAEGDLRVELEAESAVRGRVTDEQGDAVRGAQVTVYRESRRRGVAEKVAAGSSMTDDRGEYEVGPLRVGRYFVAVHGRPWYATRARAQGALAGAAPAAAGTGVDPALDAAYPLTYFPGVEDEARAGAIPLGAGEVARADVTLVAVRAVTMVLRGPADAGGGGRFGGGGEMPQLWGTAFGERTGALGETDMRGNGVVEVHGLAPGSYRLETGRGEGEQRLQQVTVGAGGAELNAAAGEPLATVSIAVVGMDGQPVRGASVMLLADGADGARETPDRRNGGETNDKGEARMWGVREGRYRVMVFEGQDVMGVERTEQAGKVVEGSVVRVAAGEVAARVLAVPAVKGVDGVVERAGKPVSGAMVVLLPVDAEGASEVYRRDQSDQDGTFTLRDVVPGRYIVVAVEDGWAMEWSRRGVMERYLGRGVAVEVRAGEHGVVRLGRVVEAQAK